MSQRVVLSCENDSGDEVNLQADSNAHLEVAVHSPRLPFGSIHTESLNPIFQCDPVYGTNAQLVSTFTSGSGGATTSDSNFVCSTGATIYSQGVITSRKRLRYRPGQGVIGRFTALFSAPATGGYQVIGFGHAEDGVYVGFKDTTFGILYTNRGQRAIYTLTVSTGASVSANATITLNDTGYTVALTNASNIQRTVWEISQGTYSGWDVYPASSTTVVFVRKSAGTTTGAFSYSAGTTGSAASIAQTVAGAAETQSFVAQTSFNGDTINGSGPSGVTIDTTKYNVFQINFQYLGAGVITIDMEIAPTSGNNASWVTIHTLRLPNTLTTTSFRNPSFPFTMAAYSGGSTTNISLKCGSFAGFIEGAKYMHGPRYSYFNSLTNVGSSNYQALFTVMNARVFTSKTNQAVINIISVTGALKHTSPCIFYLIKGGALSGNPSFASYDSGSCSLFDNAATTVTVSNNSQILWTGHLGDTGEIDHHFGSGNGEEFTLQPGEWITLAAKAVTGTPSYVTGSINTREDQ